MFRASGGPLFIAQNLKEVHIHYELSSVMR